MTANGDDGNGKNPYALRRAIGGAATLVALIAYFALPDDLAAAKLAALVVFFALVTLVTYFQQQHRSWKLAHRTPDDYDDRGRLKR